MALGFRRDGDYERAQAVFEAAEFTTARIGQVIGRDDILAMPMSDVPHVMRRSRERSTLNSLIHLFFLGLPLPEDEARWALAPLPLDVWVEAELLDAPDSQHVVAPRVQFWPVRGFTLAVDMPWRQATAPPPQFVVPPGPLTFQLGDMMIDRPCQRVLDLGTGSGMLALKAAAYAGAVIATDTNPRALEFTRFNARFNGIGNVECLEGDLFAPVSTQRFNHILCNPPFVISPTHRFQYRDSGQRGDEFCRRLIHSAVDFLEVGGFFQCTGNIPHIKAQPWREDFEHWFDGLGCDALVLIERTVDASEYVTSWILSTESKDVAVVSQRYESWMNYFERERIEAVSYFFATIRRTDRAKTWIQIDDPPCHIVGPCGAELARFFAWRDAFDAQSDAEPWLRRTLRVEPGIRIEQVYEMTDDGLDEIHVRISKTGGLRYPLQIHPRILPLLAGCDGRHTLGQLCDALSTDWDLPKPRTVATVLPVIRSLLERDVLAEVGPDV